MGGEVILKTVDIWKWFGKVLALREINLEVYRGELLVLLGPSGSGKSTLLRIIGGLEFPSRGRVYMDGEDITFYPPYKRDTSMVFQSLALFPHMTVYDNVAYGLKIRKVPKDEIDRRVDEILELVKIRELRDRKVTQLSGGQRQRVAIARSLILNPKVLLLDEPLGALDLKLRKELHVELKRLHKEVGNTWIFVTHDQEEALTLADRIGIMNNGRIEQIGDKWDVYERPSKMFVADFIGETNIIQGSIKKAYKDYIVIDWRGIELYVPFIEGCEGSKEIYLSIRPENISISKTRPRVTGKLNLFNGEIIDEIFKGSYVTYYIKLPNKEVLRVTVLTKDADFDIGDKVFVYWKPRMGVSIIE